MFPQMATDCNNLESLAMQEQLMKMMLGTRLGNQRGGPNLALPRMDVYKRTEDGATVVWMELPGMKKDQVEVNVVDNMLVISGRKPVHGHDCSADEEDKMFMLRTERDCGAFLREVPIPRGVEQGQVKAEMNHGLLKVVVPKVGNECHHHRIQVS